MIRGAVFDLDHTLFDRYATIKKIMPAFCEHFDMADGMSPDKASTLLEYADRNFVHINWRRIFKYLCENGMFKNPPDYENYAEFLFASFRRVAVPFDFSIPMLRELRESGIKTGLITNGSSSTQRAKLDMLGLEPYFDEIVISGEFGVEKPHKEPFDEMAHRLCEKPNALIYVGDHPKYDVDGSHSAGYTPVWIKTTGTWVYPDIAKPELQADDVRAIPVIIARLNQSAQ